MRRVDPEEVTHEVCQLVSDEDLLLRSFYIAHQLSLMMTKKTDVSYDKKMRDTLKAYLELIEAKLFNMGVKFQHEQ